MRCFTALANRIEHARELVAAGHLVSFTGIVTFKNSQTVQETAAVLAGERVYGGDGLPLPGAHPASRQTLRARAHAPGGGEDRRAARRDAGGDGGADYGGGGGILSLPAVGGEMAHRGTNAG